MQVRITINGRVRYTETPATPEALIYRAGRSPDDSQVFLESEDGPDMLVQWPVDLKPGMAFQVWPRFITGG